MGDLVQTLMSQGKKYEIEGDKLQNVGISDSSALKGPGSGRGRGRRGDGGRTTRPARVLYQIYNENPNWSMQSGWKSEVKGKKVKGSRDKCARGKQRNLWWQDAEEGSERDVTGGAKRANSTRCDS
ncbi:hypothetical protein OOU_Y34scaffold00735g9 [Pyricularia oryzae Y34]|nr:hypothetical protein OOU_Y34scaffold00735g9 [Pyricularia oryzae Y34]